MDNIVKNTEINTECVESYFEKSALSHKDINAVLDVSNTKEAIHSNIYRDYFTKKYLQKNVSPNKSDSILDFGCGVGRITYSFSKFANRVDGIDTSKNMIEVAAAKKEKIDNVNFTLLKGTILPFPNNSYNKIFSNWVFQHISDEKIIEYLKEFYRILPNGGKIYLFEQTMLTEQSTEKHIYRKDEDYSRLIESVFGFKKILVKPVMRVPSRGMSLWNKKLLFGKKLLPLFCFIDNLTMNYKRQNVKYYTTVFIYEK